MTLRRTFAFAAILWVTAVSVGHVYLNMKPSEWFQKEEEKKMKIGFLPVTCHLTCPVTDFINRNLEGEGLYEPMKFSGWPELKEAFISGHTKATFILAPMAIALREQGVPIKIVYLGHRDGTALMVQKDSDIRSIADLRGKTVAVPNRYSNQRLLIFRALNNAGMSINDIKLIEMPPPDMPAGLYSKSVDAVTSGEPFMGQCELDGYGRVLYLTKDIWPNFISCVLAVHEDEIRDHPDRVQKLVSGIANSGMWIDKGPENRSATAQFVSKRYYNQHPRLLEFVLSKPPDRVTYSNLALQRANFEEIEKLGVQSGILKGTAHFEDYTDTRFSEAVESQKKAYDYSPAQALKDLEAGK
ncbi:ABC transporter substrate-binding protein [Luteolibacter arcticus]|uniref:ABC transporter substrate-binding protein n=1 Tax=Luteolibacter arcticus TaxID=1581411 RepID=A0ABT3GPW5_9BACT|nr:ABC transporter substrate-binding protein [Luteolibacter arcticus]MCW1925547.1 ABC transporter substrate-binding protein [Luteolibacter arcticus]